MSLHLESNPKGTLPCVFAMAIGEIVVRTSASAQLRREINKLVNFSETKRSMFRN